MTTRPATLADTEAIARIHVAGWHETYRGLMPDAVIDGLQVETRRKMWERILGAEGDHGVWVATDELGEVIGFASSGPSRSPELPYAGELYAIYLLKAHHGRGLGRELFERVVADRKRAGDRSMLLWVLATNPTRGFYEAMGGRVVAEKTEDFGGAALVEQAMGWDAL